MEKLFKIPLVFLFIASCIGLFLRYQLISPVNGVVYSYVLHAHSHVMFLGWVFNVLILALTMEFAEIKGFKVLFWLLQFCVLGMLISFPLQGYGAFSITFSTLHTFTAFVFIIQFFRTIKTNSTLALTLAKAALLYFALSSMGPFFLGYLKANALDHLDLYRNSIYFYLHFQYNGFFLFGVLSLFLKLTEDSLSEKENRRATQASFILIASCLPTFFLSILWSGPAIIFNIIGFVSAFAQLIGLFIFIRPINRFLANAQGSRQEKLLFSISFSALILKSILQLMSAHPSIAVFANEFRSVVIAYLHLILLGGISLFLIAWLGRKRIIELQSSWAISLVLIGFIASEIMLVISPWNGTWFHIPVPVFGYLLFLFSVVLAFGIGLVISTTKYRSV
ncbi:MAG TPA: hypothetical protein PK325_07835 [Cyclobacteriaceae bacterium]|nr:hypothetical protein [Cyclobacteriaceae bacterium]HNC10202.1 hypothetical protein [Cyclobacteriaceae bacterium]HNC28719.1 hypothetical protein [Cyclobacteriaceae bacterium]HNF80039.1 hypothetical protein [Cyclobacteriaceae bacterium]